MLFNLQDEPPLGPQSHSPQDHAQRLNRPPFVTNHAAYILTGDLDLEHGNPFGYRSPHLNFIRTTHNEPMHLLDEQPCSLNIGVPGLASHPGHI
jgi:hypothetical protein